MFFRKKKQKDKQKYKFPTINKKVPLLTLDHRWHELFPKNNKPKSIQDLENKLNKKLAEQGKLNTNLREYTLLKKKMMSEIVEQMEEAFDNENDTAMQKLSSNKQYINDINERIESFEEKLEDIPDIISELNMQLLNMSMQECYHRIQNNKRSLDELEHWIIETREKLKNKIVDKDEIEEKNQKMYSYMHNLLGHEIIEQFDASYWNEKKPEIT